MNSNNIISVTLGSGKITHYAFTDKNDTPIRTICGSGRCTTGSRRKSVLRAGYNNDQVTCVKCLDIVNENIKTAGRKQRERILKLQAKLTGGAA